MNILQIQPSYIVTNVANNSRSRRNFYHILTWSTKRKQLINVTIVQSLTIPIKVSNNIKAVTTKVKSGGAYFVTSIFRENKI